MRRLLLFVLLLTAVFYTTDVHAQSDPISELEIQFWPDFDNRSVLVLLTGTLSAPGTISVPFPEDGDFLVLARIDSTDAMIDDIGQPEFANGTATFTLPGPDVRFRLEYYMPYTANDSERNFSYTWQSDVTVNQLVMHVQRPGVAASMTTIPETTQVQSQTDGLVYYELPAQPVPAGQSVSLQVDYTMSSDTLTVTGMSDSSASTTNIPVGGDTAVVSPTSTTPISNNTWFLIGGGVVILAAAVFITWQLATHQTTGNRTRKPVPRRTMKASQPAVRTPKAPSTQPKTKAASRFCHECGEPAQAEDRFCRNCGATLK